MAAIRGEEVSRRKEVGWQKSSEDEEEPNAAVCLKNRQIKKMEKVKKSKGKWQ